MFNKLKRIYRNSFIYDRKYMAAVNALEYDREKHFGSSYQPTLGEMKSVMSKKQLKKYQKTKYKR